MGRVDSRLAARLALRAALARIVAEHPELTTAEFQARLDAWLGAEALNNTEPPTDDSKPAV
jgi:hypothetical protein